MREKRWTDPDRLPAGDHGGGHFLFAVVLRVGIFLGIAAMMAAVVIGGEDGPTPADQLWRKKALAKSVLWAGAGLAGLSACGLYLSQRRGMRRPKEGSGR